MTPPNSEFAGSIGTLNVRVLDDLVLTAGSWRQTRDDDDRMVARIEPPETPMFSQVVGYLEARPNAPASRVGLAEEARVAVAVCLGLGSYFAVLADRSHPLSPTIADQHISQIHDEEMARLNIEISAALAWWFNVKGSDDQRYRSLVQSAFDQAWPPPADRVLPFMTPYLHPRGWSYTDYSRTIDSPLRADAAIAK